MAQSVEAFALLLIQQEQRASESVTAPVLVWSVSRNGADTGEGDEHMFGTQTGGHSQDRPREGEALYYFVKKTPGSGNPFAMGITIGRADNNDVHVVDGSVSRFHAYFQQEPRTQAWRVVDAGSKNGTWMGPLKLSANTPYPVADGARLRFGDVEMVFWLPPSFLKYVRQQLEGGEG